MKRFISLILILSLVLLFCPSTFAASSSLSEEETTIKQTEDGYVMVVGEGDSAEEYPVGRIDIYLSDPDSVAFALNHSNIAQEVKDHISRRYASAIENGNTEAVITLYSAELLPRARFTQYECPYTDGSEYYPMYRTVNGIQMRTDRVYEYGYDVTLENVASGASMRQSLASLFDITLSIVGEFIENTKVSLTLTGISILSTLIEWGQDSYITGDSEDNTDITIYYNTITQWTYCNINNAWQLGLVSQRVGILEAKTEVHTFRSPESNTVVKRTATITHAPADAMDYDENWILLTESFSNPWNIAYQNMNNPLNEYITLTVRGQTVHF